jgi:CBS domain-containing protein
MRAGPFRRVPVVNKKGKLVGLLSIDDVLNLLAEEFKTITRLLRKESPNAVSQI